MMRDVVATAHGCMRHRSASVDRLERATTICSGTPSSRAAAIAGEGVHDVVLAEHREAHGRRLAVGRR